MPGHRRRAHANFDPASFPAKKTASSEEETLSNAIVSQQLEAEVAESTSPPSVLDLAASQSAGPSVLPQAAWAEPERDASSPSILDLAASEERPASSPLGQEPGVETDASKDPGWWDSMRKAVSSDGNVGKMRLASFAGKNNEAGGIDRESLSNAISVSSSAGSLYRPSVTASTGEVENWNESSSDLGKMAGGLAVASGGYGLVKNVIKGVDQGLSKDWEGLQTSVLEGLSSTAGAVKGGMTIAGSTGASLSPLGIVQSGLDVVNQANKFRNAGDRGDIASDANDALMSREFWNKAEGKSSYEGRDPSLAGEGELERSAGLSQALKDQYQTRASEEVMETTHKQQSRAALNGSSAALVTAGRATTLATGATGVGAGVGAGLEIAGHSVKAGGGMLRGLKRMWRNKFGKKNNGGLKQGKLVADRQDLAKNDAAKAHRAMVTASTLKDMVGTPEGVQLMKALGFSGKRVHLYKKGESPSVEAIYGKLRKRE